MADRDGSPLVFLFARLICYLCINKTEKYMITVTQSLSGKYFSANIPDVVFTIGGYRAAVTMAVDGKQIYSETLYPVEGQIELADLPGLLTPYARQSLIFKLKVTITEEYEDGRSTTPTTLTADILFSLADVSTTCADFIEQHFLTLLMSRHTTSLGRLEYLHYIGTDEAVVTALYSDLSEQSFKLTPVGGNSKYTTIDVSPVQFRADDKELIQYTVTAGSRSMIYEVDPDQPDCAPILIFVNSFGVEELLYCTGKHQQNPEYKRDTAYIRGKNKNYRITETRKMEADTGIMTFEEAEWAEDLFRSQYVRIVNFYKSNPNMGKEVIITDAKATRDNQDDTLPRFTFSYQYAQRNHNVLDIGREGRIFDNTFDNTFN